MKEEILKQLENIEIEHDVKILFAVESGSRAWGFHSADSDYDVRFVYIHKPEWYLSIDEKRDVIEVPINDMLDINGWDIRKALKLFRKSNPPLLEWIVSDIVYYEDGFLKHDLNEFKKHVCSNKSMIYHYLSMAKRNFREYLQTDEVRLKKYFYVLRPILACIWIELRNSAPPISFHQLVNELIDENSDIFAEIKNLLDKKMSGDEFTTGKRVDIINEFIEEMINHFDLYVKTIDENIPDPTEEFDSFFRFTLKNSWREV